MVPLISAPPHRRIKILGQAAVAPVLSGEKFPPAPLSARQARPRGGCQAGKPRPRRQYRRGSSRRSRRPLLPSGARADSRHELRGHRLWRSLAGFWIDPAPALQLLFYPANSATAAQTAQSNEAPITEIARAMASGGPGVLPSSTKPCSVSPHLLPLVGHIIEKAKYCTWPTLHS